MPDNQDLRPYYDAIWDEYLAGRDLEKEITMHRVERARFHRLIEDCMERVARDPAELLEIGSGTAIDSYIVAENTSARITGIDISIPSLQVAARCGRFFPRRIDLAACDAERLPFGDATFDVVFSQGVVEHFRDPHAMVEEQARVLRPDGVLVINVPQARTGYTRFKHKEMEKGTWPWGWETEYTPGQLKQLGRRHGFKPIAVMGYDHWGSRRGTQYWRHAHERLQGRYAWANGAVFRAMARLYDKAWVQAEERLGHYFLINLTMAFVRGR